MRQLLGIADESDTEVTNKVLDYTRRGIQIGMQDCQANGNAAAAVQILGLLRQAALLGIETDVTLQIRARHLRSLDLRHLGDLQPGTQRGAGWHVRWRSGQQQHQHLPTQYHGERRSACRADGARVEFHVARCHGFLRDEVCGRRVPLYLREVHHDSARNQPNDQPVRQSHRQLSRRPLEPRRTRAPGDTAAVRHVPEFLRMCPIRASSW